MIIDEERINDHVILPLLLEININIDNDLLVKSRLNGVGSSLVQGFWP